jgi:isochorismate pyruvate lyase
MSLDEVREQIDRIDAEIVRLIARRSEQVARAGSLKVSRSDIPAPDRVEAVIRKVRDAAELEGVDPDLVEKVYRTMISEFIQQEIREFEEDSSGGNAR